MSFIRRIFGHSESDQHFHGEEPVPGWDAITAALEPIYGSSEPIHWGTITRWRFGGPDPLDGISAYRAEGPPAHWHFVSYGLSELYQKESDSHGQSGWGIELTFRLQRERDDERPPNWALGLLQNLARYIFESTNVLHAGDHMDLHGPIALGETTEIRAVAFAVDPELGRVETPHGSLVFTQVVGITIDEYEATQRWDTDGLLGIFRKRNPFLVTDLQRTSSLADPSVATEVATRTAAEGSSMGQINVDRLAWSVDEGRLVVTFGAHAINYVHRMIEGRLPFGRGLWIQGPDSAVAAQPADRFAWHDAGAGVLHVDLPIAVAQAILRNVPPSAGTYDVDGYLRIVVQQTIIRDADGKPTGVVG